MKIRSSAIVEAILILAVITCLVLGWSRVCKAKESSVTSIETDYTF